MTVGYKKAVTALLLALSYSYFCLLQWKPVSLWRGPRGKEVGEAPVHRKPGSEALNPIAHRNGILPTAM